MKPFTKERFVEQARAVHGDRFDYSLADYKTARLKVAIRCLKHGIFYQIPDVHTSGGGCDKCAHEKNSMLRNQRASETYIKRAVAVHGSTYEYSNVRYINARYPIEIECRLHGPWMIAPYSHLMGTGCRKCQYSKVRQALVQSLDDFIKRAMEVHGCKYDYSLVCYKTAREHVEILCANHGIFHQSPDAHVNKRHGCPRCLDRWAEQNKWLDGLQIPDDTAHRQVRLQIGKNHIIVDGFDPLSQTVYEFWGTYYHGHPTHYDPIAISYMGSSFGELFARTQAKADMIKNAGYTLVEIWEHEWIPERYAPVAPVASIMDDSP